MSEEKCGIECQFARRKLKGRRLAYILLDDLKLDNTEKGPIAKKDMFEIKCTVNGKKYTPEGIEPRLLLVHYLRDNLNLTGTHIGCDTGHCGACTVMIDGKIVKSCMILAVQANGANITTI